MPDMNDLKLTDEEIMTAINTVGDADEITIYDRTVANAATSKAVWGVINQLGDWLDHHYPDHRIDIGEIAGGKCPHCALTQKLRDDGIPYPEKRECCHCGAIQYGDPYEYP